MKKTLKNFSALILVGLVLSAFQNCGALLSMEGGLDINSILKEADIAWTTFGQKPETNTFGRVTRWPDTKQRGLNLYPPQRIGSQMLNHDLSGIFDTPSYGNFVRFGAETNMSLAVADVTETIGDNFTIILTIDDLIIPSTNPQVLRLFSVYPVNGDTVGLIVLDAGINTDGLLVLIMIQWFDSTAYSTRSFVVPDEMANGPLAVAMRFDKDAALLQLAVNGVLATESVNLVGAPPLLGNVARNVTLHAAESTYGSDGEFSLMDFVVIKRSVADGGLASLSSGFAARVRGIAVASPDLEAPDGGTTASDEGALLYANKCASCHGSLASSPKRGISLNQLNSAIANIPSMSGLSTLSASDREKIVNAL